MGVHVQVQIRKTKNNNNKKKISLRVSELVRDIVYLAKAENTGGRHRPRRRRRRRGQTAVFDGAPRSHIGSSVFAEDSAFAADI